MVAHLATLRQMSLSVAGMLQAGLNPNLEAAVVKDLGTTFEQEIPEVVHDLLGIEPSPALKPRPQTVRRAIPPRSTGPVYAVRP